MVLKEMLGIMILIVIVVTAVIPVSDEVTTNFNLETISNELASGTAYSQTTLSNTPVDSITLLELATSDQNYNDTTLAGANSTRLVDGVGTDLINVTSVVITYQNESVALGGEEVTVAVNGNSLGTLLNSTNTFTATNPSVAFFGASNTFTFTNNVTGTSLTNITNITINSNYWNTYATANYNTTTNGFVPANTGEYRVDYVYKLGSSTTELIVDLIPLIFGLFALIAVVGYLVTQT